MDISQSPELLRLVEEVRRSNTPRVLWHADEEVAILVPVASAQERAGRRAKTEADYRAFLAAAGGWKDLVDTDQLKRDIAASRAHASRPPVEL